MSLNKNKIKKLLLGFVVMFAVAIIFSLLVSSTFSFNGTTIFFLFITFIAYSIGVINKKEWLIKK